VLIGWIRRVIVLGSKTEECPACHSINSHLLIRRVTWGTLYRLPLIPFYVDHGLRCGTCFHIILLSFRQTWRALRSGTLHLDQPRVRFAMEEAARHPGGDPDDWALFGLPPKSTRAELDERWETLRRSSQDRAPDPKSDPRADARSRLLVAIATTPAVPLDPADVFDEVRLSDDRGRWDRYLRVWPLIAVAILALVIIVAVLAPHSSATGAIPYPGWLIDGALGISGG
jgi:hypothetical protein